MSFLKLCWFTLLSPSFWASISLCFCLCLFWLLTSSCLYFHIRTCLFLVGCAHICLLLYLECFLHTYSELLFDLVNTGCSLEPRSTLLFSYSCCSNLCPNIPSMHRNSHLLRIPVHLFPSRSVLGFPYLGVDAFVTIVLRVDMGDLKNVRLFGEPVE